MSQQPSDYRGYRFPTEIIAHVVWSHHRFGFNFRDVDDLVAERESQLLFDVPYFLFTSRRTYGVAPDDQRVLMLKSGSGAEGQGDGQSLEVVMNRTTTLDQSPMAP